MASDLLPTLPHSPELERFILDGLMYRPENFRDLDDLQATDFYGECHREVFSAMRRLREDGEAIDEGMLQQQLGEKWERCMGLVGGLGIDCRIWEPAGAVRHLRSLAVRRRAVQEGLRLAREAEVGEKPAEALRGHLTRLEGILAGVPGVTRWRSFETVVEECPLPYPGPGKRDILDPCLIHLEPAAMFGRGTLTLIVGRTGEGKSAYAIQVATANAREGHVCAIFSLEMPAAEVMYRILAAQVADYTSIRRGLLTDFERHHVEQERKRLRGLSLYVDDRERLSVDEVCAGIRELQRKEPELRFVVVDYLSLLELGGDAKERHDLKLGRVAKSLAVLSRELRLAVALVCQLGRGNDRENREPRLSDVAGSDEVAYHAYSAVSVWQPEGGQAWVRVLKNRGGARPRISVAFDGPRQTFFEVEPPVEAQTPVPKATSRRLPFPS